MKIHLEVELPDALFAAFVQHIRDFDQKYDAGHSGEVHFDMHATSTTMTDTEAQAIMDNTVPPFAHIMKSRVQ